MSTLDTSPETFDAANLCPDLTRLVPSLSLPTLNLPTVREVVDGVSEALALGTSESVSITAVVEAFEIPTLGEESISDEMKFIFASLIFFMVVLFGAGFGIIVYAATSL